MKKKLNGAFLLRAALFEQKIILGTAHKARYEEISRYNRKSCHEKICSHFNGIGQ